MCDRIKLVLLFVLRMMLIDGLRKNVEGIGDSEMCDQTLTLNMFEGGYVLARN